MWVVGGHGIVGMGYSGSDGSKDSSKLVVLQGGELHWTNDAE